MAKRAVTTESFSRRIRSKIPRPFGAQEFWPNDRISAYGLIQLNGVIPVGVNLKGAVQWLNPFNGTQFMSGMTINQLQFLNAGGSGTPWTGDDHKLDYECFLPMTMGEGYIGVGTGNYILRYRTCVVTDVAWIIEVRQPDSASSDVEVRFSLGNLPNSPPIPSANTYGPWHYSRILPWRQNVILSMSPNLITSVQTMVGTIKMHKLAGLTRAQYMSDPNNWCPLTVYPYVTNNKYSPTLNAIPPIYVSSYTSNVNVRATFMCRIELFNASYSARALN